MGENIHSKNTYYHFLENDSFNWPRLLFLLSAKVPSYFQSLCNPSRCGLFVIDDSTIHRDRNKKADLLHVLMIMLQENTAMNFLLYGMSAKCGSFFHGHYDPK